MAYNFMEGFDGIPTTTVGATVNAAFVARGLNPASYNAQEILGPGSTRTGVGNCYGPYHGGAGSTPGGLHFRVAGEDATAAFGMAVRSEGAATWDGERFWEITDVNGLVCVIRPGNNDDAVISIAYNPSGTANDINTTVACTLGAWHFIEVVWASNKFEFWIDGVLAYSKVQTAQAAIRTVYGCRGRWNGLSNKRLYYDDCYYTDSGIRWGEGTARVLPLGTQVSNTGTVTNAADAAAALLAYDDAAKYVTYAAGQKSLVNVGDITDSPLAIACVQVAVVGKKTGTALTTEQIKLVTGSEANISTPALPMSNVGCRAGVLTDPHDSAAWTKAKINAMQVGVGSA